MKEWVSVQVGHHNDVGPTIMSWEQQGWHLSLTPPLAWAVLGITL
jgi:hypothetical protein